MKICNFILSQLKPFIFGLFLFFAPITVDAQIIFTQWTYQPVQGIGTNPTSNTGSGTSEIIGMTLDATFNRGIGSTSTSCGTQSSTTTEVAWSISSANPGTTNESRGGRWSTSTVGYQNIIVSFDQRWSGTAPNTIRFQYTTNGVDWINFVMTDLNTQYCLGSLNNGRFETNTTSDRYRRITVNLSALTGVNNNPNFGFRVLAAHYQNTGEFRQVSNTSNLATGGTWRFDNITISGTAFVSNQPLINTSASSLNDLVVQAQGNASLSESFNLTAQNLTPISGNLNITAPSNFEISSDNSTFSSNINIAYSDEGSTISNNIVYVRLVAGLSVGEYSGNVVVSGADADAKDVAVSGKVYSKGLSINTLDTDYTIDFDASTVGVSGASFNASSPLATFGTQTNQLDNGSWSIQIKAPVTTTPAQYPGDFSEVIARGITETTFAGNGIYAVEVNSGNRTLGFQPTGTFLASSEGSITLRAFNNTGAVIPNLLVDFDLNILNDGPRSNFFNFYYSTDNITYINVTGASLTSPQTADSPASWQINNLNAVLTGINLQPDQYVYLRWGSIDNSGSGNRDKFSIDNIIVRAAESSVPVLSVSENSLSRFCATTSSASASQSFTFEASDLNPSVGNIDLSSNNSDFEFSLDNNSFSNTLSIPYSGGLVSTTSVFVRLKSGLSSGSKSATLTVEGGDASQNVSLSGESNDNPTLEVGDITLIGHRTSNPDQLSFVTWTDLPANTEIRFTDNAYDNLGVLRTNEQTIIWTSGADEISAGTVIRGSFPSSGGESWTTGNTLSGSSLNSLSGSGENIFAYQGTATCPSFIYGLSTLPWISTGNVNTNNSYLPSELNIPFGNISTGNNGNFEYGSTRQCFSEINDYKESIHDLSNWNTVSGNLSIQNFTFTNEVEIIGESFMILCGSSTSTLGFNSTTPPESVQWFRNDQPFSSSPSISVNKWSLGQFYAVATFCNGEVIQTDLFIVNTIKVLTEEGNNAHYSKVCLNQNTTFSAPELANATYQWRTRPGGTLVSTDRVYTFTGFSGSFVVFITSETGCTRSTRVRVLPEKNENCEIPEDFVREENYNKTALMTIAENNPSLIFYPNPVNSNYSIEITGLEKEQIFSVEWIDIAGKKVAQTKAITGTGKTFNHSVSGISAGLYFVNVRNENHNFTLKIMVK